MQITQIPNLILSLIFLSGCTGEDMSVDAFFNEPLHCPKPAVAEFQAWGKSGTQHICKIKHGPFVAWESGYIHVRGQFENGREVGVWFWYDNQGNVVKRIDYAQTENQDVR